ncbi:MAG: AAA family ATPase [Gammaproteobacteria bacterium]|nr:AAA family ATPase [Gammaproteobacteria bacterium]
MYKTHFALTRYPFEPSIGIDELFPARGQEEAEARIRHLLELRGIGLLTGEPGCGKSTVCRRIAGSLHPGLHRHRYLSLTTGSVVDLYTSILQAFGLPLTKQRAQAFHTIRQEVSRLVQDGGQLPVLVIDEAHLLGGGLLEEIRLLTNYRMDSDNRLCLLLAGHTELRQRITMSAYESLRQRIVVRCHLDGLDGGEVAGYLQHRLKLAGAAVPLFPDDAVCAIAQATNGVPRKIDRIAHLALCAAALGKRDLVDTDDVQKALDDTGT